MIVLLVLHRLLVLLLLLALHLDLLWHVLILSFFSLHDTWIIFTITGLLSRNNCLLLPLCLAMSLLINWYYRPSLQHLCRGLVERLLFHTIDDGATLLLYCVTKFLFFVIARHTTPFLWLRWNDFWCNMWSRCRMSRLWCIYNWVVVYRSTELRWCCHFRVSPTWCIR